MGRQGWFVIYEELRGERHITVLYYVLYYVYIAAVVPVEGWQADWLVLYSVLYTLSLSPC